MSFAFRDYKDVNGIESQSNGVEKQRLSSMVLSCLSLRGIWRKCLCVPLWLCKIVFVRICAVCELVCVCPGGHLRVRVFVSVRACGQVCVCDKLKICQRWDWQIPPPPHLHNGQTSHPAGCVPTNLPPDWKLGCYHTVMIQHVRNTANHPSPFFYS